MAVTISEQVKQLGLETHVLELELDGLTVVPPEVHGVTMDAFDDMVELLLAKSEQMIGCRFTLDRGPHGNLEFSPNAAGLSAVDKDNRKPGQFLIQQLGRHHRLFRDLAVNPVAVALIRHMIGDDAVRFSSHNSFVKWQDDFGYGPTLGLHCDQTQMPRPWGRAALTANTNWCLTDYTKEGGSFAYVPGSHRLGRRPDQPRAASRAVPVECAKGSVIAPHETTAKASAARGGGCFMRGRRGLGPEAEPVPSEREVPDATMGRFHGATWHGAFPRLIPGMRLSIANYYRHHMVMSQEDIRGTFPRELADDCDDPALFKQLAGFNDRFPYAEQSQAVPILADA